MKYVIIGNGPAGIAAAVSIRNADKKGEITIISAEEYDVYSKCMLPDFLSGDISERQLFIRNSDFYAKHNFKLLSCHTVTDIAVQNKVVIAVDETKTAVSIPYDKLLLATGSKQNFPLIPGLDESSVFFGDTLKEAKKLREAIKNAEEIAIIGAGYVGLEIASNLKRLGKKVTVIDKLPEILKRQLDNRASKVLKESLEAEGIKLILGVDITGVSSAKSWIEKLFASKKKHVISLSNAANVSADIIIVSAGSKPNLDFLKDRSFIAGKGIAVDRYMQSSQKDIYAAGDVVESIDAVTGNLSLSPIWPNAVIQGSIAGSNMAGIHKEFEPQISMQNASEFREIPFITMGLSSADDPDCEEYVDDRVGENVYRKLVIKDDKIVGLIFLNDIHNAGVLSSLMKNGVNISKFKDNLLSPSFGYSEVSELIH